MYGGHRFCADRSGAPSRIGAGEISTGMAYKERREGGPRVQHREMKDGDMIPRCSNLKTKNMLIICRPNDILSTGIIY